MHPRVPIGTRTANPVNPPGGERSGCGRLLAQERCPILHQPSPLHEQVAAGIGGHGLVHKLMRQRIPPDRRNRPPATARRSAARGCRRRTVRVGRGYGRRPFLGPWRRRQVRDPTRRSPDLTTILIVVRPVDLQVLARAGWGSDDDRLRRWPAGRLGQWARRHHHHERDGSRIATHPMVRQVR